MYRENIEAKIASAMKSGNKVELAVWRAIKTEFMLFNTAEVKKELTDEVELKLIRKLANQRKDSAKQFTEANRPELAENELAELAILESMLPKEPSVEDIEAVVKETAEKLKADHALSMKDMQAVQNAVKSKFPTVNGGTVAQLFKKFI